MGRRLITAVAAALLTGCLYVHSDRRLKLAEEARSAFDEAVSKPAGADPVASHAGRRAAVKALAAEMHRAAGQISLHAILSHTWETLRFALQEEIDLSEYDAAATKTMLEESRRELQNHVARLAGARKTAATLVEALNAAALAAARHAATQDLLQHALVAVVDEQPESYRSIRELLAVKKRYRTFEFSGHLTGHLIRESHAEATIGALLGIDVARLHAQAPATANDLGEWESAIAHIANAGRTVRMNLRDPGIATTIIGLGLDLARAEEMMIRTEIEAAKRQIMFQERLAGLVSARSAQLRALQSQERTAQRDLRAGDGETIRDTLERAAAEYVAARRKLDEAPLDPAASRGNTKARGNLAGAYLILASDYRNRVLERAEIETLETEIASFATDRQLAIAAINLVEREAVIARGLEGLVAFHQGGFDDDDTKGLIGLAQAVGLFLIGGL